MKNKVKPYIIICDVDNVYTDSREWEAEFPKNADINDRIVWDVFHRKCYKVKPNYTIVKTLSSINDLIGVCFITAREDRNNLRDITIKQIEEFSDGLIKIDGVKNRLFMRAEYDFRSSYDIKEEVLLNEILPNYNVAIAIDDDLGNIEMYKKYNIPTKLYSKFGVRNGIKVIKC